MSSPMGCMKWKFIFRTPNSRTSSPRRLPSCQSINRHSARYSVLAWVSTNMPWMRSGTRAEKSRYRASSYPICMFTMVYGSSPYLRMILFRLMHSLTGILFISIPPARLIHFPAYPFTPLYRQTPAGTRACLEIRPVTIVTGRMEHWQNRREYKNQGVPGA